MRAGVLPPATQDEHDVARLRAQRSMRAGVLPPATRLPAAEALVLLGTFNEGRGLTPGDASWPGEDIAPDQIVQ